MKKRMSSSGSKVSIPKWLGTWFHMRYMQDQEKVNGIRPISVVSSHNWSSAGTAWLIEIVIDPKIQLRIDLLHQPAVQGEIDGAPGGGSINDTTWRGLISATFTDFTRCKQPYYYSFPDDDNLDLKGLCNGVNPIQ